MLHASIAIDLASYGITDRLVVLNYIFTLGSRAHAAAQGHYEKAEH